MNTGWALLQSPTIRMAMRSRSETTPVTLLVGTVHAATADGDDGRLQVADVSLSTEARGVVATYTVENVGDEPVRAGDVTLAFETAFGADARVYRHGYQSWSSTGTLPVGERFSPRTRITLR